MHPDVTLLRSIRTFPQLVKYLRDKLDWPIETDNFDDLTFDYDPEELGIDAKTAVKIKDIKQLRPLVSNQPWGIFFISFEPKRLPIVVLRRILRSLVIKKRASATKSQQAAWNLHDILFISSYGESEHREITFAHFSEPHDRLFGDLPTLRVLGWDDDDTKLKIDYVVHTLAEKMHWPENENDVEVWRKKWSDAFELRPREVITTSKELAIRLAALSKSIRQRANLVLGIESEKGSLRKLHKAFQTALIHDLNEDDFADMYAQTISYGLLAARVSRPAGIIADNLADLVPLTNPFLKEMLGTFLSVGGRKGKIDFDELGIQEVVDLLNSPDTHMEAILRDFGKRTMQEDPVIHFYELFLKEYDKKKKVERGVFYTPQPVVSYIVRSVDELLKKEFGLEDGLASTITWGEMAKRNPNIKIPEGVSPDEHFVQMLDPATGTATFLVEIIEVIYQTMISKWRKEKYTEFELGDLWNEYVPKHLLPRLYGFELMMAPYAIAHMKIGLKLAETGYKFRSDERAHIYLTNSLEPPSDMAEQPEFEEWSPALAHEAKAVNAVKRKKRFTVVVGNPPYSNFGKLNKLPWILKLIEDYKQGLEERKINLDDDYIKFIRYMQQLIQRTGRGIISIITNNSYLDGVTHRKMRHDLANLFNKIFILNLHGNLIKKEGDENVFDIRVGVGVATFLKTDTKQKVVSYFSTKDNNIRTREGKYTLTANKILSAISWKQLKLNAPGYWFVPKELGDETYQEYWSLSNIFRVYSVGIGTKVDSISIDFDADALKRRIKEILTKKYSKKELIKRFGLSENTTWEYNRALRATYDKARIINYAYRPFDTRKIFYDDNFLSRSRSEVMDNFYLKDNIGLEIGRLEFIAFVSDCISDEHFGGAKSYKMPLLIFTNEETLLKGAVEKQVNFTSEFLKFAQLLFKNHITPVMILSYIYSILYCPQYRERYQEELIVDFPRVPFAKDSQLFRKLAMYGERLIKLHLLKFDKHIDSQMKYLGNIPTGEIEKITYEKNTAWIDKAKTQGFQGVQENVWNFHIGGYQVCEKWLKDRKGRTLSDEDINHYQRIVVALNETIRIMAEIDKVIDQHGGWPGAFQDKKADAEYTFQPEPLLKAAEETAEYSPQGKVEVYSKSTPSLKGDWQTWLALSKWAKQTTSINTFWGEFALEISNILNAGKQLTDKQKENMKKCWQQAVKKGFEG
jgi:hypothetical protein